MSLAGFNPNATLLTPNPAAQVHVYSGGANVGLTREQVQAAIGVDLPLELFNKLASCTYNFTDLSNIICDEHISDADVAELYELMKNTPNFDAWVERQFNQIAAERPVNINFSGGATGATSARKRKRTIRRVRKQQKK
jgi:hypothetical protein